MTTRCIIQGCGSLTASFRFDRSNYHASKCMRRRDGSLLVFIACVHCRICTTRERWAKCCAMQVYASRLITNAYERRGEQNVASPSLARRRFEREVLSTALSRLWLSAPQALVFYLYLSRTQSSCVLSLS